MSSSYQWPLKILFFTPLFTADILQYGTLINNLGINILKLKPQQYGKSNKKNGKIILIIISYILIISVILSGVNSIKIVPTNPAQHPCHGIRCAPDHSCTLTRRPCLPFLRCGEVPSCIPTSSIQRRKDDPTSFQEF